MHVTKIVALFASPKHIAEDKKERARNANMKNNNKQIANPLSKMVGQNQVQKMFGKKTANQLLMKPVYQYSHKGIGEGLGDLRNAKN